MIRDIQTKNSTSTFFILVCVYYLAYTILPILSYLFSVYIQITIVLLIVIYIISNKYAVKSFKFFIPFLPIIILELLVFLEIQTSFAMIIGSFYKMVIFALPAFLAFYLIVNNYRKAILSIVIISIIFYIITSITSIFGLFTDANASRMLSIGELDENILMNFNKRNIGSFGIVYMIPLIIPMLFAVYKKNKVGIIGLLLIVSPLAYFVYLSQFSMALMLLIVSMVSIVIARNYSFRKLLFFLLITILFFFFSRPIIGNVFYLIAQYNESQIVSVRLNALGDIMTGIGSNAGEYTQRIEKYEMSRNAFFSSPFLGVFNSAIEVGGHSFIMDKIALFGIFGIIALILLYRQIYKFFYKPFAKESYYGYMVWSLLSSVVLAAANPTSSIFIISLIVPLIAYLLQDKNYVVINGQGRLVE